MKILFSNAIGILLMFSVVSCTEEIAEEVQNKEAVSSDGSIADYSGRSIRLVHKMAEDTSFNMHKSGNYEADCELTAPTAGFDSDTYDYTSTNYAIDCVLDVEELDLYFKGVEFEMQVDDQLCEYVRYVPYRVLRHQPGSTTKTIYNVTCDENCAADATSSAACGETFDSWDGTATDFQTSDFGTAVADTTKLCHFDYASQNSGSTWQFYPNCDEGEVTVIDVSLSGAAANTCDNATGAVASPIECGGDYLNCLDGAAKEQFGGDMTFTGEIYDNAELESFSQSWSYSKMFGVDEYSTNMKLANFSRICAEPLVTKTSGSSLTGGGAGTFSTVVLDGAKVEDIRTSQTTTATSTVGEKTFAADNLFRGAVYTKPYYGFYCLDKAYDVKAQIRLFIREWDRSFASTNTYQNYVSDTFLTEPLMDAGFTKQSPDSYWNSIGDLDDFFEQDAVGSDDIIDKKIWLNNQCDASTTTYDPGNFPGRNF